MEQIWHHLSCKATFHFLNTRDTGLTQKEAIRRQTKYGKNKLPDKKRISGIEILWTQFKNPLIFILIIAAFITLALQEFIDCGVIVAAVLINALIGFVQENKAEKTLDKLKQLVKHHAKVIRESEEHVISSEDLVPGDIIILESGDIVSADARLLETKDLQMVEAALTGESIPSGKKTDVLEVDTMLADRENIVFMGTIVTRGKAKAIVIGTGLKTEIGKIAALIEETAETQTPLQKKMGNLARIIGLITAGACLILLIAGLLTGLPFVEMLLVSVAMAVAGIPEGLVIATTVCLAIGMQRILKKKALVKKLVAAETLGSVTIIASDKTGTLTEGKMSIAHILPSKEEHKEELLKISLLSNNAIIENPKDELKEWKISGDTTEIALLLGAIQSGLDREQVLKDFLRLDEIPFESEKMYMATLHEIKSQKSKVKNNIILVKGAPEKILTLCHLTKSQIKKITAETDKLTRQGLRLLAFARKEVLSENRELQEEMLTDLEYLGLIALKDPLRPEARETIKECREAGIKPIIITGDHRLTARVIGEEIGLLAKKENILEGRELDKLSDEELKKEIKKIDIFARVEPKHKIRIINALRNNDEVVAMTGDGVNDAPAIKAADIGIALGSGSEVTKEAADIVLLDDNFKTIVEAVKEGRTIFDNIKKIITFLLADGFSELVLISGAIILGWPLPVLAAQILWINIIEDSLPAMALTYEKSEAGILREKPRGRSTPIFNKEMKFIIFIIGILTDLILLGLFWFLFKHSHYDLIHIRTIIFVGLGIDSLFFLYSCKSLKKNLWQYNPFNNKLLNLSVLFGFVMFLAAIYLPAFQTILRTTPLNLIDWSILIILGLLNIILIELTKLFFIRQKSF